jgi:hypothetical protein
MNYLDFNSRDTYLKLASQWKAEYAQLSLDIRASKRRISNECRETGSTYGWAALTWQKGQAASLINQRHSMKEQAGEQMRSGQPESRGV